MNDNNKDDFIFNFVMGLVVIFLMFSIVLKVYHSVMLEDKEKEIEYTTKEYCSIKKEVKINKVLLERMIESCGQDTECMIEAQKNIKVDLAEYGIIDRKAFYKVQCP